MGAIFSGRPLPGKLRRRRVCRFFVPDDPGGDRRPRHGLGGAAVRIQNMISLPSRHGAYALVLSAALFALPNARAQTAEQMVHTDSKGRHFAPHDTFYTLDYVSARTDKRVEGYPPGTEVHLVSVNREAHTLTVTDGHANVELSPDKLTNDMDIANFARAKDQANQAQIVAYQQAEAKAFQEYEKQAADYTAKDLENRQKEQHEADARAQEHAEANTNAQAVNSSAGNNGYYNEGGYGYGSPYGYFANLTPTNVSGSGKGVISTQNSNQSGGRSTGTTGGGKRP